MRHVASLLLAVALLFAPTATAQFHPVGPGATKVVPSWGPEPPDPNSPENIKKYNDRITYLIQRGFEGTVSVRVVNPAPIPGFPAPPKYPYVVFSCRANPEESIHSYELFLLSPSVTLTELKIHCLFGDPKKGDPFIEPKPEPKPGPLPQPAVPVGREILAGSGLFYVEPGDRNLAGYVYESAAGRKYLKVVRTTPFGQQSWYRLLE